ncbi:molybdenum cofactor biosynthesis protein MoaE [Sporolactobacillus sp. CQH2019]|uniref:molybdenum cofactor biosynthesis protein MoaE n=1 Tax=Sporolactobacillus sp. CQH2019 TaxID=3023512 RepID=UPI002368B2BC|nr:molybdenum cofactor biosynthesis protein MoaE [Sporolactobacillus sp. CQH2019]MDD9149616.1 molybdenum cofactor biosynthesis protein MoaE [Sporolactobacillus sp. CQH2019]
MAYIRVTADPLDVETLYKKLKAPSFGGVVVFVGTVRQWTGSIETEAIEYSAHKEMAIKELAKISAPIESRGVRVVIAHRIGLLRPSEEVVFVGTAAGHRKEAFRWCEYLIDTLKARVPIWKREVDVDKIRWGGPEQAGQKERCPNTRIK